MYNKNTYSTIVCQANCPIGRPQFFEDFQKLISLKLPSVAAKFEFVNTAGLTTGLARKVMDEDKLMMLFHSFHKQLCPNENAIFLSNVNRGHQILVAKEIVTSISNESVVDSFEFSSELLLRLWCACLTEDGAILRENLKLFAGNFMRIPTCLIQTMLISAIKRMVSETVLALL